MDAHVVDINIVRGKTFEFAYRYADEELVRKTISGMPSLAPVRLTIPDHGIPDGWPIRIIRVRQPVELNSEVDTYYKATVIDASTIELNKLSADLSWRAFIPEGTAEFIQPFDLTGCSARMQIRDKVDGKILLTLNSDSSTDPDGEIDIDVDLAALVVRLSPAVTAAIDWTRGVYDLELITPDGNVYAITAISKVTVGAEVTK